MAVETVIIDFQADYSSLDGAIDTLLNSGAIDAKLAASFKQTTSEINKQEQALKKDAAAAKDFGKTIQGVDKATKSMTQAFMQGFEEGVTDALKEAGLSAKTFEKAISETETKSKTLRQQLKELTTQMQQLQFDGKENTEEFERLRLEAGRVGDAIDEVNNQIKNSRDGEATINSLVGAASALAGGFAAVQGTVALFGDESEELQETLLRVNAAMAVLQGLQAITVALQSDGAITLAALNVQQKLYTIQTNLATAAESKNIIVRGAATVAQRALNAVMAANPIGLVITALVAVSAALVYFTSNAKKAAEEQGRLNAALSSANELLDAEVEAYENSNRLIVSDLQARGAKESQVLQANQNNRKRILTATEREIQQLRKNINESGNADTAEATKRLEQLERDAAKQRIDIYVEENSLRAQVRKEQEDAEKAAAEQRKANIEANIAKERERLEQVIAGLRLEQIGLDKSSFAWKQLEAQIINVQAALDTLEERGNKAKLILANAAEDVKDLFRVDVQQLDEDNKTLADKRAEGLGQLLELDLQYANKRAEIFSKKATENTDLEALQLEISQSNYEDWAEGIGKKVQAIANVYSQLSTQIQSISAEQNKAIEINIENQRKQVEEQLELGTITEREAAQRNARIDAQERQLKTRQAQRDKQLAIFNAIIGTAQAIVQALTAGPIIGPILAGVIGALGAAQIAAIGSRPIPKFAKGKKDLYEGPGIVGEAGAELVQRGDRMYVAEKPTLTWIGRKDKVFTATETRNILMPSAKVRREGLQQPEKMDYEKLAKAITKNLPGGTEINIDKDFISVSVADAMAKVNYLNRTYHSK